MNRHARFQIPKVSICNVSIFCILIWIIPIISGLTQEEVREQLMEKYQIKVPPPTDDPDKPVQVGVGITVNYFTLEEADHVFLVNAWIRLSWKDKRLAFDSSTTNGTMLRFGSDELWVPDITLYNNAFPTEIDHYGDTHMLVSPDGTVLWIPPSRLAAHCTLNMIRWPYDTHTCELKFGSWTHHGKEIDLVFVQSYNDSAPNSELAIEHTNYVSNSEWTILKNSATRNSVYYSCCPEPYVDLTFSFTFQRVSPSYTAIFVVPIIMISLVNMLVFILPPTSGEKVILGSLNFFILCIFLLFFQAKVPPLGDHLPLLVLLYVLNLVLVSISLAISVLVLNLSRTRRVSSPPQCFRIFCNTHFATALGVGHLVPFVSQTHSRLNEGVEMRSASEVGTYPRSSTSWPADMNGDIKDDQTANLVDYEAPYMANAEWILLASMIDRISLIVFAVANGIIIGLCLS